MTTTSLNTFSVQHPLSSTLYKQRIRSRCNFSNFITRTSLLFSVLPTKGVARSGSAKKVFLKMLQNSQENTCVGISFLIKLQARKIFVEHFVEHVTMAPSVPAK